ncbi:MAG: alanine--tRNA ligase [Oscillospiraceae bacterium]|nr:alanine--tRNA ligase [Oscillospiraceae bacterium]
MNKKYGVNELREMFLSFFESKGHLRLPSFSLIPQHDPSLLLINSGMAPMKPYFTGEQEPPRHRVCTCQKCIRTGDIENIGKTARHGTYFEMLGNFSFGDYFKKEAIAWSWEFLTSPEWVGLDPERLYPSVYVDDDEAASIWHEDIGIPTERIFRFGKEDNFWEHGSGPCGPCSEIYYDRGPEYGCGKPTCTVGCDCDRYMEVWNNVFSQFNNDGHNNYTELAQKNIDTGMGLERLAVVCQDVDSLFDVDTVMNITNEVSRLTGATYGQSHKMDVSLRVITDHIRSATMMICDGVLPSNERRGYVLRRLLRRAARHGKLLGMNEPFLYKVVDMVIHENECAYPDLREKRAYITKVVRVEEENFAKTIDAGMHIFADMLDGHKTAGRNVFSGEDAFRLYDTYGFPLDMTEDMAEEAGMSVDEAGFQELMEQQRRRAREARGDMSEAWQGLDLGLDNTPTEFTGYEKTEDSGEILAMVLGGELTHEIATGAEAVLVLDKTPFYAEMGGQTADQGVIKNGESLFRVTDVQKNKGGKYLHSGTVISGGFSVGDKVETVLDLERRNAIRRAHSATHLLQKALQNVLGDHVHQAGSYVEADYLRFDFTHFSAVTPEELRQVATQVNDEILSGLNVDIQEMPIDQAREKGAMALFGEKYGDIVRVVDMGGWSVELCGGTHVDNTAKIGPFRIVSESSIASGVRRIEAVTGKLYLTQVEDSYHLLARSAAMVKAQPAELADKLADMLQNVKNLRLNLDKVQDQFMSGEVERFLFAAKNIGGIRVLTTTLSNVSVDELRRMGDMLREREPDGVAVFAAINGEKLTFLAVCGKNAVAKGIKAGDIIKQVCAVAGGHGGGKAESAMGGGKDVLLTDNALAIADDIVAQKLGI